MLESAPFAAILGQPRAIAMLAAMLRAERYPGALLFAGPEGSGRKPAALALAAAASCRERFGCGLCPPCRAFAAGDGYRVLDVAALRLEEKQVEALREELSRHSLAHDRRRFIVVIEHAELLSDVMQATLLKAVEEPPPRLSYVLLAPSPAALLPTLRSRAVVVPFQPLAPSLMADLLRREGVTAPEWLMPLAGGSLAAARNLAAAAEQPADLPEAFLRLKDRKGVKRAELLQDLQLWIPALARLKPAWKPALLALDRAVAQNASTKLAFAVFADTLASQRVEFISG